MPLDNVALLADYWLIADRTRQRQSLMCSWNPSHCFSLLQWNCFHRLETLKCFISAWQLNYCYYWWNRTFCSIWLWNYWLARVYQLIVCQETVNTGKPTNWPDVCCLSVTLPTSSLPWQAVTPVSRKYQLLSSSRSVREQFTVRKQCHIVKCHNSRQACPGSRELALARAESARLSYR